MTSKVRNWCLGTVVGAVLIGALGNIFYDGLCHCWAKIAGQEPAIPALELLSIDGKRFNNEPAKAFRHEYPPHLQNGVKFPILVKNNGEAIKSPLKIEVHIPKSLSVAPDLILSPSTDPKKYRGKQEWGFEHDQFQMPGGGYTQKSALFFSLGSKAPKPTGRHTILVVVSSKEKLLFQGEIPFVIQ